ncbi:MAG: hypothetical protein ABEH56_02555 [Salinirussus sp.]
MDLVDRLGHPVVRTGLATALGYGVVLAVLFGLLFVVPFLIVSSL